MTRLTRRDALRALAVAAGGACTLPARARAAVDSGYEYIFFSKPFQHLSFAELADLAAELGFDGLEFPVRPGGHVEPQRVEEDLPRAVEAFAARGVKISMIASGINSIGPEQHTEVVLKTAAGLGIPRCRMAYYKYDLKQPIPAQLEEFKSQFDDLVALTKSLEIKAVYQNHSGAKYLGAAIWDLYYLFKDHSPEDVGSGFDIGHAVIEGTDCWRLYFRLMLDYLDVAYFKAPTWNGQKFTWCPLSAGSLPEEYCAMLAKSNFKGPLNLHVEYIDHLGAATFDQFKAAFKQDLATLKRIL